MKFYKKEKYLIKIIYKYLKKKRKNVWIQQIWMIKEYIRNEEK